MRSAQSAQRGGGMQARRASQPKHLSVIPAREPQGPQHAPGRVVSQDRPDALSVRPRRVAGAVEGCSDCPERVAASRPLSASRDAQRAALCTRVHWRCTQPARPSFSHTRDPLFGSVPRGSVQPQPLGCFFPHPVRPCGGATCYCGVVASLGRWYRFVLADSSSRDSVFPSGAVSVEWTPSPRCGKH